MRRRRPVRPVSMAIFALVLAATAAAWLSFSPCWSRSVSTQTVTPANGGEPIRSISVECRSLVESEGRLVVGLFVIPLSLAMLGWHSARTGRPVLWTGLALILFSVVALATVGLFFLPAGIALLLASITPRSGNEPEPA